MADDGDFGGYGDFGGMDSFGGYGADLGVDTGGSPGGNPTGNMDYFGLDYDGAGFAGLGHSGYGYGNAGGSEGFLASLFSFMGTPAGKALGMAVPGIGLAATLGKSINDGNFGKVGSTLGGLFGGQAGSALGGAIGSGLSNIGGSTSGGFSNTLGNSGNGDNITTTGSGSVIPNTGTTPGNTSSNITGGSSGNNMYGLTLPANLNTPNVAGYTPQNPQFKSYTPQNLSSTYQQTNPYTSNTNYNKVAYTGTSPNAVGSAADYSPTGINPVMNNQVGLPELASLFGPNSAYAQQLRQQLERKDSAAGRNSQYGTREVELQARLAEAAAKYAPEFANAQIAQQNANLAGQRLASENQQFGLNQQMQRSNFERQLSSQEGQFGATLSDSQNKFLAQLLSQEGQFGATLAQQEAQRKQQAAQALQQLQTQEGQFASKLDSEQQQYLASLFNDASQFNNRLAVQQNQFNTESELKRLGLSMDDQRLRALQQTEAGKLALGNREADIRLLLGQGEQGLANKKYSDLMQDRNLNTLYGIGRELGVFDWFSDAMKNTSDPNDINWEDWIDI